MLKGHETPWRYPCTAMRLFATIHCENIASSLDLPHLFTSSHYDKDLIRSYCNMTPDDKLIACSFPVLQELLSSLIVGSLSVRDLLVIFLALINSYKGCLGILIMKGLQPFSCQGTLGVVRNFKDSSASECSAQGQVRHCKAREPRLQFCRRQVFSCKLCNED